MVCISAHLTCSGPSTRLPSRDMVDNNSIIQVCIHDWLNPSPEPGAKTAEPTYPTKVPAVDLRDAEACGSHVYDILQKTTNAHSPPRGISSPPKVRNMPREPNPTQDRSLGASRRILRSLSSRDSADSGPPGIVRLQHIVTMPSYTAARRWQELELEPILEQRMSNLELQPLLR